MFRQLESLIRLTEARAKLELREEATEADATDIVEIMQQSICDAMLDEMGELLKVHLKVPVSMVGTGTGYLMILSGDNVTHYA